MLSVYSVQCSIAPKGTVLLYQRKFTIELQQLTLGHQLTHFQSDQLWGGCTSNQNQTQSKVLSSMLTLLLGQTNNDDEDEDF